MKLRIGLAVVACFALVLGQTVAADDLAAKEAKEFKATCPVSGGPAKEESSLAYKGKKVYFCCNNCPKAFEKDSAKFAAKANFQLVQTGQAVQVACPVAGKPVNKDTAVEFNGVSFAFCCNGCKGKFEKAADADKVDLVFADFEKGFTVQTECPVSGKAIDVTKSVEYKGKKVYFCCGGCPDAFKADPDSFLAKLPQFADEKEVKKE